VDFSKFKMMKLCSGFHFKQMIRVIKCMAYIHVFVVTEISLSTFKSKLKTRLCKRAFIDFIGLHAILYESRWLCGNTLASDANGPGSTPGGTLELDTGHHPVVDR